MRLKKLHLKAFGPFTDRVLDFGAHAKGLVLVHGPNEAGKSSALRAISDLRFGIHAYQEDLLPVVLVPSSQVSAPVIARYRADGMLVLTGVLGGGALVSTLTFFDDVIGYSLKEFFERNHGVLKAEITRIVASLLRA